MPILDNIPGLKEAAKVAVLNVHEVSEEIFLCEYVANGRPCLVKGAVRHWAASQKWRDPEYLKQRCGDGQVSFFPHENHVTYHRMKAGQTAMTFAEAIDRLHAKETGIATLGLPGELTALRPDLGRFPFFRGAAPAILVPPARHFLYRGAGTAWHYHSFDETFMCQVVGAKMVGMLNTDNPSNKTLSDIFSTEEYYDDPAVFERLGDIGLHWFSAELEPGDALYIPPLWWHGVSAPAKNFGMTVAVTWRSPLHVIASTIRKIVSGHVKMTGYAGQVDIAPLMAVAAKLGLEREFAALLHTS